MSTDQLEKTIAELTVPGRGILAADESTGTIEKRFKAMNTGLEGAPWQLRFSYGRALQAPALKAWRGEEKNRDLTQQALLKRASLNSAACQGRYTIAMEVGPGDRQ